jgi:Uma2 family endonuclease
MHDAQPRRRRVFYPTSDGKPMAETDRHRDLAVYVIEALKSHFADRPDVYVSGNNFVFYREGDPSARVSPDAYVVMGVPMRQRDSYMAWKEDGHLPDVIFEFTSRKTRKEDTDTKRPLYETVLKVPEYFLFDPTGDYLKPRFQGYRLQQGQYVPLEVVNGRLHSERLGLDLVQEGERLRLYDPATGECLLNPLELAEARRAEAKGRRAEADARAAAEAENARLRAELEALRRQMDERKGRD